MERFCTNCGNTLEDGVLFCPECGERVVLAAEEKTEELKQDIKEFVETAVTPEAEEKIPEIPLSAATPVFAGAAPAGANPVPVKEPEKPVAKVPINEGPEVLTVYNKPLSTAAYFWTLLLFFVPVIGLIAMLIMAFAAKNTNRRNLAQACLIGLLILLILLGLFMLVLVVSGKSFGVDISKFSLKAIWEGILTGIGFSK